MARFLHGSINHVHLNPCIRRRANRPQCAIGPHLPPPRPSLVFRHNLAHINWSVVSVTGVCSFFLTGALTVIICNEIRLVERGKARIAWIPSKVKPFTLPTSDPSPLLNKPRTEDQALKPDGWQHHSPSPLLPEKAREETTLSPFIGPASPDAHQLTYPEENPAACEIAAMPIPESTNIPGNLRQESCPMPTQPLLDEPGQIGPSTATSLPASCTGDFGTSVKFVRDPQEAFRLAGEQKKLVFLLHLSGNFEDPNLT